MDWIMLDKFVSLNRNALELMLIIARCLLGHCTVMYGLFFFYKTAPKKDIIKNIRFFYMFTYIFIELFSIQ